MASTSPYVVEKSVTIAQLKADEAFVALTQQEASYALALSNAEWSGAKICLVQASVESVPIFSLLRLLFSPGYESFKAAVLGSGVSEVSLDTWAAWACTFIDNLANYKSFGDTKFVPGVETHVFEAIIKASPAYAAQAAQIDKLWGEVKGIVYDLRPRLLQMGMGPTEGISTYYSANVTKSDAELVQRFTESLKITQLYNSRLFKLVKPDGSVLFQVRLASAESGNVSSAGGDGGAAELAAIGRVHEFEGQRIEVVRGDHAPLMARVVANLEKAVEFAANDTQKAMIRKYAESFRTGSMQAHIEGSAEWVKDKGPVVESYIGFIESYRDPLGVRGEWEGFVAVVNKATSAKFQTLVDGAESFLQLLPWGKPFEKDTFLRPDFTSLEVLAFTSSGIPAGINIPNYVELRQTHGFKNVSLGNVLSARNSNERVTFISDADQDVYRSKVGPAFEVQVGLHELLGHGSGKLFQEDASGKLNFDVESVANPLVVEADAAAGTAADGVNANAAAGRITSWYKPGTSWDTVFGALASTMEECRAEAVGIYLCVYPEVLKIFGHPVDGGDGLDIVYVNWLNMARAGLLALQYYTPATKQWGQAHMQARYALLRVMLEAGQGFVEIKGMDALAAASNPESVEEGQAGVHITLDRSKIMSVGVPAVAKFLKALQVYKATADVTAGSAMYNRVTSVPDEWLPLRSLVVAKRKPRQMFVQPCLVDAAAVPAGSPGPLSGTVVRGTSQSSVALVTFPATVTGLVDSFVYRWPQQDPDLLALWEAEKHLHVVA